MTGPRRLVALVAASVSLLLSGCITGRHALAPPPPPPQNYLAPETGRKPLRRVALLPLWSEKLPGDYLRDLDSAFNSELTKMALFEVVPVSRTQMEAAFGERQLASIDELPSQTLSRLRAEFGVDGVVFTDLTHFSPYRPLAMAVRAKLVDVSTGEIRWAFDYAYDSGNAAVATAARKFQLRYTNEHQALSSDGGSILLSPSRFAKYVASQTYASMRPEVERGMFSAKPFPSPDR
ncbi:MAG: DUF799 domain-containing protein [Chthoniobacter sp.]|nr:DUF799 domain-containing protein [Chthoniobacter sp.]